MISLFKDDYPDCVVEIFSHGCHRQNVTVGNGAGYHATEHTFTKKKFR